MIICCDRIISVTIEDEISLDVSTVHLTDLSKIVGHTTIPFTFTTEALSMDYQNPDKLEMQKACSEQSPRRGCMKLIIAFQSFLGLMSKDFLAGTDRSVPYGCRLEPRVPHQEFLQTRSRIYGLALRVHSRFYLDRYRYCWITHFSLWIPWILAMRTETQALAN